MPLMEYDRRKRVLIGRGRKALNLPYRYVGADDGAGPNCTGEPAVDSNYRPEVDVQPRRR
jgi:hypothetical protein